MSEERQYKWTCTHGTFESRWADTPKQAFDNICLFSWEAIRERFEEEITSGHDVEPVIYIRDLVESCKIPAHQVRESYVYLQRHIFTP